MPARTPTRKREAAARKHAIGPIMDKIYKSYNGHVVIRVAPGGERYEVFVLDDKTSRRSVLKRFGPISRNEVDTVADPGADQSTGALRSSCGGPSAGLTRMTIDR